MMEKSEKDKLPAFNPFGSAEGTVAEPWASPEEMLKRYKELIGGLRDFFKHQTAPTNTTKTLNRQLLLVSLFSLFSRSLKTILFLNFFLQFRYF